MGGIDEVRVSFHISGSHSDTKRVGGRGEMTASSWISIPNRLSRVDSRKTQDFAAVSVCSCGLPNEKFCMLNLHSVSSADQTRKRNYRWVPMSICSAYSSSTPVIQFPNSDSIYGSDIPRHHSQNDNFQSGDSLSYERDRQKLKEVDLGNKRPSSRHSTSKKAGNVDKAAIFDRDRDELRPLASSLPSTKQLPIRANGIKNNLLRGDAFFGQRNNPPSGREEDIVAMGTLWSPGQLQNRSSISIAATASNKSNNSGFNSSVVASTTFPLKRSVNAPTNISSRQLSNNNAVFPSSSLSSTGMGNIFRNSPKEVEPKYTDPLAGAPPSFQQRLMELASLEAETVRWERAKKVKKKTKQDRDS